MSAANSTQILSSVPSIVRAKWADDEIATQARRDAYRQADIVLSRMREQNKRLEAENEVLEMITIGAGFVIAILSVFLFF